MIALDEKRSQTVRDFLDTHKSMTEVRIPNRKAVYYTAQPMRLVPNLSGGNVFVQARDPVDDVP